VLVPVYEELVCEHDLVVMSLSLPPVPSRLVVFFLLLLDRSFYFFHVVVLLFIMSMCLC